MYTVIVCILYMNGGARDDVKLLDAGRIGSWGVHKLLNRYYVEEF